MGQGRQETPRHFDGEHVYKQVKDLPAAHGKNVGKEKGKNKRKRDQEHQEDEPAPPDLKYWKKTIKPLGTALLDILGCSPQHQ
jgi:hypothetical protein